MFGSCLSSWLLAIDFNDGRVDHRSWLSLTLYSAKHCFTLTERSDCPPLGSAIAPPLLLLISYELWYIPALCCGIFRCQSKAFCLFWCLCQNIWTVIQGLLGVLDPLRWASRLNGCYKNTKALWVYQRLKKLCCHHRPNLEADARLQLVSTKTATQNFQIVK